MDNPLFRLLSPQPMQYQQGSGAMPVMPQAQMQPQAMQGNRGMNFMRDLIAGSLMAYGGAGPGALIAQQEQRQRRIREQQEQQQEQAQLNQTKTWLKLQKREDLIPLVDAGQAGEAIRIATQRPDVQEPPTSVQEYNYAKENGFEGSFMDFFQMKKDGVNVNNYGSIPQGYEVFQTPEGATQMRPIPGGPEDTSKQDAARADNQAVQSDVIISAAQRAREAVQNRVGGEYGQILTEGMRPTAAAEVKRQVAVLQSTATIEALNQMRQQSPTGGALGNVTEGEGKMLAAKAGALDPASPTFLRDLDDYERTLLRTIHGKEAGDIIYQQTRKGGGDLPQGVTEEDVQFTMQKHGLSREEVLRRLKR